jgi:hypothetical protein
MVMIETGLRGGGRVQTPFNPALTDRSGWSSGQLPLARLQEHRGHPPDLWHLVPSSLGRARTILDDAYQESQRQQPPGKRAESVLTPRRPARHLAAETAIWSTITQIYEGTNQIQRMVMARQLLK